MMNLVALSLVATSLAVAGLWSPSPAKTTRNNGDNNVIVKEGHRVVVIEYDKDGNENTKVVISPEHDNTHVIRKPEYISVAEDKIASSFGHAKEKAKEAASELPNLGERHGVKEVICDAFGKCRETISGAVGRGREKVEEEVHGVEDVVRQAKDTVGDAYTKAKESAEETITKARDSVNNAEDTVKNFGDEMARNLSEKAEMAREKAAQKANESVPDVARKAKNGARRVISLLRRFFLTETLSSLMNVVNLLGFSTAYGICLWVTFISSNVLAAAMPRHQFGMVQSKIYPVYFRAMAFSIGMAFLGHIFSHGKLLMSSKAERFQGYNLLGSLLAVIVNAAYLEPQATKVMFERMKIEKEEGRGIGVTTRTSETERGAGAATTTSVAPAPSSTAAAASERLEQEVIRTRILKLNRQLKKLNSYSSFVNILTLMGLTWHLVYLGQRLHMTC